MKEFLRENQILYASIKLRKELLYQDYKNLEDFYNKTSLYKESKRQNFLFGNEKTDVQI